MTTQAYEVIVGANGEQPQENAIANASGKLFGELHGEDADVFDVNVYGGGEQDYGIGLCVAFESESIAREALIEDLPFVESFVGVHYEEL